MRWKSSLRRRSGRRPPPRERPSPPAKRARGAGERARGAPPAAWESLVLTGKARAAIRRATRVAVRHQYAGLGRRIVERLCQRAKIEYTDEKLEGAFPRLAPRPAHKR